MKCEIKSRWSGEVMFSLECGSIRLCVEAAVKSRANLSGANLSGANLYGANLSRADLYGADLSGADLSRANLYGANLSRADLYGADLSRANLYGANLYGANLSRADLYGADLSGADLYGADLSGADLSGADLYGANLYGADLSRADLSGADLSGADLSGADLSGADLSRANLSGALNLNKHLLTPLRILFDQPGKLRAYKLVTADWESPWAASNGAAPITYAVGKTFSVKNANGDETQQCEAGINLATMDWCLKNWKDGYRLILCEFSAKDIACIPTGTDGKFRVRRCKVVKELRLADYEWPPKPPETKGDKAAPVAANA